MESITAQAARLESNDTRTIHLDSDRGVSFSVFQWEQFMDLGQAADTSGTIWRCAERGSSLVLVDLDNDVRVYLTPLQYAAIK